MSLERFDVLQGMRENPTATDVHGRLLAADAELRLLQLLTRDSDEWHKVAMNLAKRLNDYQAPLPAAEQRRFLMHMLAALDSSVFFPSIEAEDLAANFLARPTQTISAGRNRRD